MPLTKEMLRDVVKDHDYGFHQGKFLAQCPECRADKEEREDNGIRES